MNDKIGLRSFQQGGESFVKSFSDETNYEIDVEIRKLVDKCYQETRDLLTEKKHLIEMQDYNLFLDSHYLFVLPLFLP